MKFFRFFAVILALFASTALFGADELPADPKPMDMINFLRQAAIKNDASMALQVMHGPLAEQMIRTGKMPKELRQMMLDLTAAFEDTYIRATGDKALVYIFVTQDNKEKCFKVRFDPIAGGVLRIVEFAPGTIPGARVYLDRFIAACKDGKQNLFHAYLSDALKTQFPAIPQSLQLDGQVNISQVKNSANEAIFAVKYLGITGNIKLTRVADSLFWEITEIDPILTAPLPREILARLAAYTGVYARQRDVVLDGLRQKATAETNAKRAAKLRFYEEAKARAQNDEALKNEVGKPEQVMRDFIEKIYTPRMLSDFKNYVAEEINYFENIISATEAEVEVEFKIPTRLKQKQLDILINKVDGLEVQNKTLISKAPVEFTINHERKVVSPIGELITNLKCLVSEVFASDYFILLIEDILNELQIKEYQFISAEQVMGSCLLDLEDRESGAIIVDVGYISTSVSIAKGDGLTSLKSFSMGGGHITSDLAEVLNLQYDIAEELKRKLILTLRPNPIDTYDLVSSKEVSVSVQTANEIAFARIDLILENIEKCLKKLGKTDSNKPIYLTGGGISYLKGIRHYSKNKLKRDIKLIAPAPLQLHKFELSSSVAVLNAACDFD